MMYSFLYFNLISQRYETTVHVSLLLANICIICMINASLRWSFSCLSFIRFSSNSNSFWARLSSTSINNCCCSLCTSANVDNASEILSPLQGFLRFLLVNSSSFVQVQGCVETCSIPSLLAMFRFFTMLMSVVFAHLLFSLGVAATYSSSLERNEHETSTTLPKASSPSSGYVTLEIFSSALEVLGIESTTTVG